MTSAPSGTVLLAGFMAWAVYRRVRRNIGRQKLRPRRLILRMMILGLASVLLLDSGLIGPALALTFGAGALVGVGGAFLGLRHTKFETTEEGHYYIPNTYIGVALSLLLLGRMAYRLMLLNDPAYQTGHPAMFQSPLTLFIVGLTVGYYLTYYIGLFRHTRDRR